MKKLLVLVMATAFALLSGSVIAKTTSTSKVIDATKTTFGWQIFKDKESPAELAVVNEGENAKAIRMSYSMNDSAWLALAKEATFSLANGEGIKFKYKCTGSTVNLNVKISDVKGTVFGYVVPSGTFVPNWQTAAISRDEFVYLYGGDGKINWNVLTKIEFVLDTGAPVGDYKIVTDKPGTISISSIRVAQVAKKVAAKNETTAASASTVVKTKGKKLPSGGYSIDSLSKSASQWNSMSDQDGKCKLTNTTIYLDKERKKGKGALEIDYDFGKDGVWVAVMKEVNLNLESMKTLEFRYKGVGGENTMVLKIVDKAGRVFGYTCNESTAPKNWKKVIIPAASFKYLYGGSGEGSMDAANISKLEFTIEKKDGTKASGSVFLRLLKYN